MRPIYKRNVMAKMDMVIARAEILVVNSQWQYKGITLIEEKADA